jgi:hypothetical protein
MLTGRKCIELGGEREPPPRSLLHSLPGTQPPWEAH